MNIFKQLYFNTCGSLPMSLIERGPAPAVLLPYHHVVSDRYLPHITGLYQYKNVAQFTSDLDWLMKHRTPVDPEMVHRCVTRQEPLPPRSFLLTFDDGFREVYDVIAPLLKSKGIPAIFFINPSFIDNNDLFYRCKVSLIIERVKTLDRKAFKKVGQLLQYNGDDVFQLLHKVKSINYPRRDMADQIGRVLDLDFTEYLRTERPFLTSEEVRELSEQGFTIGAHSMDHPEYRYISQEQQIDQTLNSLHAVRELTGNDKGFFSFPHTDKAVRQDFFHRVSEDELGANTLFFGTQNQRREEHNRMFHRFNAEDPRRALSQVAKGVMLFSELTGARIRA